MALKYLGGLPFRLSLLIKNYAIPYLTNDVITNDHFNTIKWTFTKCLSVKMKPPYHASTFQCMNLSFYKCLSHVEFLFPLILQG